MLELREVSGQVLAELLPGDPAVLVGVGLVEVQAASAIRKLLIRNRDPETVDFLITVRALNGA